MSLEAVRIEIDAIDKELTELLKKRMNCSLKVAEIKKSEGLPVYHPAREKEILERVYNEGGEYGSHIAEIYKLLMECSRELQHDTLQDGNKLKSLVNGAEKNANFSGNVACYGQEGAFTHIALTSSFADKNTKLTFCNTFEKVFETVNSNKADLGFLPVENSSAGSVGEVYDLLLKYKLYIVGAVAMPIKHNLLGIAGAEIKDIKTVYSHPQALSQCKEFLTKHSINSIPFSNTAAAAEFAAKQNDISVGAIGSTDCAEKSGLNILAPSIQSFANNQTRFIALSKKPIIPADSDKISLVFSLSHTPGSLQKILTRFSLHGLNLTKLESRVGKNGDFETQFYLDFLGSAKDEKTFSLLCALKDELTDFFFLGNYKEISIKKS